MTADFNFSNVIDLKLQCGDKEYDVFSVSITRAIGSYPVCVVVLSEGAPVNGEPSLPNVDDDAYLYLKKAGTNKGEEILYPLFIGFVASETSQTAIGSAAVQGYRSYRLACNTERLSSIAPMTNTWISNSMGEDSNFFTGGVLLLGEARKQIDNTLNELQSIANNDVGNALLKALTQFQQTLKANEDLVNSCVKSDKIAFNVKGNTNFASKLTTLINTALAGGLTYYDVIRRVASVMGLQLIPHIDIVDDAGDHMCICNRPAWIKEITTEPLKPSDYLAVRSSSISIAHKAIDGIVVPLSNQIMNTKNPHSFAIYGERGGKQGEASIITRESLITDGDGKSDPLHLHVELMQLPSWLWEAISLPKAEQTAETSESIDDAAKKLAMTGFATRAHQQSELTLNIPFDVYQRLINTLGLIYTISLLNGSSNEFSKNSLHTVYGRLQSLALSINILQSKLSVSAQASFTHVVPENIYKKYAISKKSLLFV